MDTVKSIVSSVSVTMIFFEIIVLLLPEGTMKKPFLNFASVALIATVISCFTNVSFSADSIDMSVAFFASRYDKGDAVTQPALRPRASMITTWIGRPCTSAASSCTLAAI